MIYLYTEKHPDPSGHLRQVLLTVAGIKTKQGEAAFRFNTPRLWTALPEDLRPAKTGGLFK